MTVTPDPIPDAPASPSGTAAAAALAEMAPIVQGILVALGIVEAARALLGVGPHAVAGPALSAMARLGAFVLAAWVARRGLTAAAALLELFRFQAEATTRLAATIDRLAGAPGRTAEAGSFPGREDVSPAHHPAVDLPTVAADTPATSPADTPATSPAEVRDAIRQGEWTQADALIRTYTETHPDDPATTVLAGELAEARQSAAAVLRERIDAAREANDPERIFETRDTLIPLLAPGPRRELDRDLARWFMRLVQKRLRNGKISIDVAVLATRVAEAVDATPEGASLHAALPTLRRSVGLCARCGQPYTGIADACPACLASRMPAPGIETEAPAGSPEDSEETAPESD
jgi:hypothetical protein